MHTKFIAAALLSTALMSAPAFAQTNPPAATSNGAASSGNWITQEKADEWRAFKLKGLNVYNSKDEKLGDIVELLMSKDGKIDAVVIGVGGFLGMGEHDVAVPYAQIKWVDEPRANSAANRPATNTGASNTGASTTTTANTRANAPRSYPDHALLDMNKDQLKAAPQFKFR
jgi:sporulation protein YlmC with PRC-barrel domain